MIDTFTERLLNARIAEIYTDHIHQILVCHPERIPYFVTTALCQQDGIPCSFSAILRFAHARYDHLYRHLTSQLMTNFSKKPGLHPLTFDFVDMPNTRHSFEINLYEPSTPHFHSIYLVHEATHQRFEVLRTAQFQPIVRHKALRSIQSIHAQHIEREQLPKIVSYASKLLSNYAAVRLSGDVPLFTQHPLAKFERNASTALQYFH